MLTVSFFYPRCFKDDLPTPENLLRMKSWSCTNPPCIGLIWEVLIFGSSQPCQRKQRFLVARKHNATQQPRNLS